MWFPTQLVTSQVTHTSNHLQGEITPRVISNLWFMTFPHVNLTIMPFGDKGIQNYLQSIQTFTPILTGTVQVVALTLLFSVPTDAWTHFNTLYLVTIWSSYISKTKWKKRVISDFRNENWRTNLNNLTSVMLIHHMHHVLNKLCKNIIEIHQILCEWCKEKVAQILMAHRMMHLLELWMAGAKYGCLCIVLRWYFYVTGILLCNFLRRWNVPYITHIIVITSRVRCLK